METWLTQLLSGANGRHFRDDELYRLLAYVETLAERADAAKQVAEQRDGLIKALMKAFPDLATNKVFVTDLVDSLQVISHAMLLDDISVLEDKMGGRFYSMLSRMECGATLQSLWEALEALLKLSTTSRELLAPYLAWVNSAVKQIETEELVSV